MPNHIPGRGRPSRMYASPAANTRNRQDYTDSQEQQLPLSGPGEIRSSTEETHGAGEMREPEVRRWPHPVSDAGMSSRETDPTLHYIYCALAYQNQLLADMKTLLEGLKNVLENSGVHSRNFGCE